MPKSLDKAAVVNNSRWPQWRDETKENVKGTFSSIFLQFFSQLFAQMLQIENKLLKETSWVIIVLWSQCYVSMCISPDFEQCQHTFPDTSLNTPLIGVSFSSIPQYNQNSSCPTNPILRLPTAVHSVHCYVLRYLSCFFGLWTGPALDLPR